MSVQAYMNEDRQPLKTGLLMSVFSQTLNDGVSNASSCWVALHFRNNSGFILNTKNRICWCYFSLCAVGLYIVPIYNRSWKLLRFSCIIQLSLHMTNFNVLIIHCNSKFNFEDQEMCKYPFKLCPYLLLYRESKNIFILAL